MSIVWHWLILSASMYAAAYFMPGYLAFSPAYVVLVVAAVLMFINATIKPIISFLTLPINILTLGLFGIVLNGLILWALAALVSGFSVTGLVSAILAGVVISVVNWILGKIF